jgi:hypothetical protein
MCETLKIHDVHVGRLEVIYGLHLPRVLTNFIPDIDPKTRIDLDQNSKVIEMFALAIEAEINNFTGGSNAVVYALSTRIHDQIKSIIRMHGESLY